MAAQEEEKRQHEELARAEEERWRENDLIQADRDYVRVRDALPVGTEQELFRSKADDWVKRRAAVISTARKQGKITVKGTVGYAEYFGVPLPAKEEILNALRNGKPLPVVGHPQEHLEKSRKEGESKYDRQAALPDSKPTAREPSTTPSKATRDIRASLRLNVSLKSPYPQSYSGAPTDKISVQYAVMELLKQVNVGYDLKGSQANVGELLRRWIRPDIENSSCDAALNQILGSVGLKYELADGKVVLKHK